MFAENTRWGSLKRFRVNANVDISCGEGVEKLQLTGLWTIKMRTADFRFRESQNRDLWLKTTTLWAANFSGILLEPQQELVVALIEGRLKSGGFQESLITRFRHLTVVSFTVDTAIQEQKSRGTVSTNFSQPLSLVSKDTLLLDKHAHPKPSVVTQINST